MRFNLYHACVMAAVLAFGAQGIALERENDSFEDFSEIDNFDGDEDFDESFAEIEYPNCTGNSSQMCDRAMQILLDSKTDCARKSGPNICHQRQIEELRRKIDDKNSEVIKARDDSSKQLSDMQKDCNEQFEKNELKTLSKDFGDLQGSMQKLVSQKTSGGSERDRLSAELSAARCEIKTLQSKIDSDKNSCCCARQNSCNI